MFVRSSRLAREEVQAVKRFSDDLGFTLAELMITVLILGVLVAMAVPIFAASKNNTQQKACYANQRTIEGAVQTYRAASGTSSVEGTVDGSHVLVSGGFLKSPPYCPLDGPTGYYGLDTAGTVTSFPPRCAASTNPVHGHY
jgi:prepilin-type N-terminal cleavage/methylation domain-containing protein